jgi:hypothetical protein
MMQETLKTTRNNRRFMVGLCLVALAWLAGIPAVRAQSTDPTAAAGSLSTPAPQPAPAANLAAKSAKRYFVEFRSRSALSYGHTFLVHGKLNAAGRVGQLTKEQVAGLHPATESSIPWMIGHVVPVISETGFSDGDIEDEYVTARYQVLMTEAEYAKVSAFIAKHQAGSPLWHAVIYNCNAWVGDVAKFMGLKTPESTLLYPEDYINGIAMLNSGAIQPLPQAQHAPAGKPPAAAQASTASTAAAQQASATAATLPLAREPQERF